jgi:hypothetical protein
MTSTPVAWNLPRRGLRERPFRGTSVSCTDRHYAIAKHTNPMMSPAERARTIDQCLPQESMTIARARRPPHEVKRTRA